MIFKIFVEDDNCWVQEYTVTMNASYSEIEDASKKENFISWVVENAVSIEGDFGCDITSNDFLEKICCNGNQLITYYYVYYVDFQESCKQLLKFLPDENAF